MWTPLPYLLHIVLQRNAFSWLFEVLPIWLICLQCLAALSCGGDVDGWSRSLRIAAPSGLAAFMGRWTLQEHKNMDGFLDALGFPSWQRALICRAGQQYTLETTRSKRGDALRIVTSDLRGRNELELPLNGEGVVADDGDDGARVCRAAKMDRRSLLVTESFPGDPRPFSECRRTMEADGRMRIDLRKRTRSGAIVAMQAYAARIS
jgi:hypothetical protein